MPSTSASLLRGLGRFADLVPRGRRGLGVEAGLLEEGLVVHQAEGVGDLRDAVRLVLVDVAGERGLEEVVLQRGGAVEGVEVAERGELGGPGDLGAQDVRARRSRTRPRS